MCRSKLSSKRDEPQRKRSDWLVFHVCDGIVLTRGSRIQAGLRFCANCCVRRCCCQLCCQGIEGRLVAFVQVDQALLTHRKTLRLARLLNVDRFAVVGRLLVLWTWCLDNALSGCLGDIEPDILADVMGWDGKLVELVEGLLTAGFLEVEDGRLWIHDWSEWMGRLIEKREVNRERMRAVRARARGEVGAQYTGSLNVNLGADPYLTLDPTIGVPGGALGVNQLAGYIADGQGNVLPLHTEIQYDPLYLWPR